VAAMDTIRWPGLAARLRGRRILDLRYEPEDGFLVIGLEGGGELWVSADAEGCQAIPLPADDLGCAPGG